MYVKWVTLFGVTLFYLRALELTLTSFIVFSFMVFDGGGEGQDNQAEDEESGDIIQF